MMGIRGGGARGCSTTLLCLFDTEVLSLGAVRISISCAGTNGSSPRLEQWTVTTSEADKWEGPMALLAWGCSLSWGMHVPGRGYIHPQRRPERAQVSATLLTIWGYVMCRGDSKGPNRKWKLDKAWKWPQCWTYSSTQTYSRSTSRGQKTYWLQVVDHNLWSMGNH